LRAVLLGQLEVPHGALALLAEIRRGALCNDTVPVIVLSPSLRHIDPLRGSDQAERSLCIGPLQIEPAARVIRVHGRAVACSYLEFELLLHLAQEPTRVFAKAELLRAIWGLQAPRRTRTLDSHASRLRRKLVQADVHSSQRRWVVNIRGVGYRLI
jgi:DNA-binding response OmpR family regulator